MMGWIDEGQLSDTRWSSRQIYHPAYERRGGGSGSGLVWYLEITKDDAIGVQVAHTLGDGDRVSYNVFESKEYFVKLNICTPSNPQREIRRAGTREIERERERPRGGVPCVFGA